MSQYLAHGCRRDHTELAGGASHRFPPQNGMRPGGAPDYTAFPPPHPGRIPGDSLPVADATG
jgi:hypothetical protein